MLTFSLENTPLMRDNMPGTFAQVGMEYGHKYGGATFELFAKISEKNHAHSTLNPLAAYTKRLTLEEIMGDMMIAYPNTRPMCSANCDGAAAAVLVGESKLRTLSLEEKAGQLFMSWTLSRSEGEGDANNHAKMRRWVAEAGLGGVILSLGTAADAAILTSELQKVAKVPLLIAGDFEGGVWWRLQGARSLPVWAMPMIGRPDWISCRVSP